MTRPKKKPSTIDSLSRGIDLLEILADRESVKLAALPELLDTSRATAFRLLKTLQERDYVEHISSQSAYRLGPAALLLARRSQSFSMVPLAQPALNDLAERTGETINLALFQGGRLTYVEIVDGRHALRMSGTIGQAVPLHSTALGKAMLAAVPEARRRPLLGPEPWEAYTPKTRRTWKELQAEINETERRGYSIDLEEMDNGAVCIGAAITGPTGKPVGGISVSGWAQRLKKDERREIGEALAGWCEEISRKLAADAGAAENGSTI